MCSQTVVGYCVSLKETSVNAITFTVIIKYWKGAVFQTPRVFKSHLPCCLSKDPLKHGFLDIYLTLFLGAGISRNTSATRSSFFGNCLKFNIDFKN